MKRLALAVLCALFSLVTSALPAAADGIRWDLCSSAGEECCNAIPGARPEIPEKPAGFVPPARTVPGTCQDAKCRTTGPDVDIIYDCLRCIEISGGSGASGRFA